MARLACKLLRGRAAAAFDELALLPRPASDEAWLLGEEPMGPGWHDSSWMLKKGLDVVEGAPNEVIPAEWQCRWWLDEAAAA